QLELARGARHEQVDDRVGAGGEMRRPCRKRIARRRLLGASEGAGEQRSEGDLANAVAAFTEEMAASQIKHDASSNGPSIPENMVARRARSVIIPSESAPRHCGKELKHGLTPLL